MKTILFQGDSITDAGRLKECDEYMGCGYATLVSGIMGIEYPNQYRFINRGISGNRIIDIIARVKSDIINLAPDYMSILVGVNDVGFEIADKNGISLSRYEKLYNMLIEEIKEALPNIKIMILEPFVLKGSLTKEYWTEFREEVEKRAESAKKIAEKNGLVFIPLMKMFDEAAKNTSNECWLIDGVHPTAAGHELIKREWLKGFEKINS